MHRAGMGESSDRTATYPCGGAPAEPALGGSGAVKYGISVIPPGTAGGGDGVATESE